VIKKGGATGTDGGKNQERSRKVRGWGRDFGGKTLGPSLKFFLAQLTKKHQEETHWEKAHHHVTGHYKKGGRQERAHSGQKVILGDSNLGGQTEGKGHSLNMSLRRDESSPKERLRKKGEQRFSL